MPGTGRIWVRTPLTGAGSLCGHRRDTVDDPLLMDFTANPIPRTKLPRVLPRPFLAFSCKRSPACRNSAPRTGHLIPSLGLAPHTLPSFLPVFVFSSAGAVTVRAVATGTRRLQIRSLSTGTGLGRGPELSH